MRVLRTPAAAVLLAMAAPAMAPSAALAAEPAASLTVALVVPVQCEAGIEDVTASATELLIRVRRSCNTGHAITLAGAGEAVEITEMATGRTLSGPNATFRQPEHFAQTSGTYRIKAANPVQLAAFSANLRVQIVPNGI